MFGLFGPVTPQETWGEVRGACDSGDWARALSAISTLDYYSPSEHAQEIEQMEAYIFAAASRVGTATARKAWTLAYMEHASWQAPAMRQPLADDQADGEVIVEQLGLLALTITHASNGQYYWHLGVSDEAVRLQGGEASDIELAREEAMHCARRIALELHKRTTR